MTWGEAKLITLQTMFSNDGTELNADDVNREYLNAMPGKANEGLTLLILSARPIVKRLTIVVEDGLQEPVRDAQGVVHLPHREESCYELSMREIEPRYRCLHRGEVYFTKDGGKRTQANYETAGEDALLLSGGTCGRYALYYEAQPQEITLLTPDAQSIDMEEDALRLLPLYMASALYKEDDLSLATVWRNEFEEGCERVRAAYEAKDGGVSMARRRNTTGWW